MQVLNTTQQPLVKLAISVVLATVRSLLAGGQDRTQGAGLAHSMLLVHDRRRVVLLCGVAVGVGVVMRGVSVRRGVVRGLSRGDALGTDFGEVAVLLVVLQRTRSYES